jgi:hypothetical protein
VLVQHGVGAAQATQCLDTLGGRGDRGAQDALGGRDYTRVVGGDQLAGGPIQPALDVARPGLVARLRRVF